MKSELSQPDLQSSGSRTSPTSRWFSDFRLLLVLLAWGGLVLAATSRAAEESPRAVVQATTDAVLEVLGDQGLSADDKRRKIEEIANERFDFRTLSRLVLARNWRRLSPQQQSEFVEEFKKHLSLTYGKNVESYNNERVIIFGDREEVRGDWTVQSRIARADGDDIRVDYRLRKRDGSWRLIDVIAEGISLVANFRSQFQDVISKQGVPKLIDLLREKNAKGEPLESS